MLLPPDLRDWLPENHLAHFILDAVALLPIQGFRVNLRGSGSDQYPPSMMLSLLIYCYATGRMGSRQIEAATYTDVAVRYICGGSAHPDHDTICEFRRGNGRVFEESFIKVLAYAQELGVLKKRGGVSVDGTKIQANASKHAAVSYQRAGELIEQCEREVKELMAKAEAADRAPVPEGLKVPEEIARRQARKAKLETARQVIEARFEERRKAQQADYEAKMAEREKRREEGKPPRSREPQPPREQPEDKAQYNFTDPESRIMKAGNGDRFEQAYNAQAAVDTEGSQLVLGARVTEKSNDKEQLGATIKSVDTSVREVTEVLADSGFFSEDAVREVEADGGPVVYAAVEKQGHHRTVADLIPQPDPPAPPASASVAEIMRHRLRTAAGKAKYALRKQTVEPVFGIIKAVLGFRRFLLRGKAKVSLEWTLVTLAYNFKRLFRLVQLRGVSGVGWQAKLAT